ncbi:MAG: hypothetical protein COB46_05490 [Rhodospirillaceae bacterium]|nr:MAG: hypothetical protein COB46_05490 [Rhodospirillaceae bacterium]
MKRYESSQTGAIDMVATVLNCDPSKLSSESGIMTQPGWDSFAQIEIMIYLSEVYSIEIDDKNIEKYSNIKSIVDAFEGN